MSNIKLFRLNEETWDGLECTDFETEKPLQEFIEKNMATFLGINFLRSEYSTGKEYGGRIDSLGIDENYCPVIIEYKRSFDKNVISQALSYLTWLKSNKPEFELLVIKTLSKEYADNIEWSMPRVLCIAGDFTKHVKNSAKQIPAIELIRYKKYGNDTLLFDFIDSKDATKYASVNDANSKKSQKQPRSEFSDHIGYIGVRLEKADKNLKDLYHAVEDFITNLGDDIQEKELKHYKAFIRIKNFVRIMVRPQAKCLLLYLNLDPKKFHLEGLTRDVSDYHTGICNVEVKISSIDDFEKTKHLIIKSYEAS